MNFDRFRDDIIENGWNVFGAEVYENGLLTHSFGDTCENLHEIYSAAKTILSVAVGIAWDAGLIDFDRPVLFYLPEEKVDKLPDKQKDVFEKITVRRFLTMSVSHLPFRPEGSSWLDFALSRDIKNPEERVFNYSNVSAYLVGVALNGAIGFDTGKFIEQNIFAPLHIERYEYSRCPEGYFYGASGMKLTVHDLSRIGLLLYNKGVYEGKRILSEEYVKLATSVQQMNREGGYGFYIWKYRDGFSINGKWGQKCYVLPERGIMAAWLSHIEDNSQELLKSMEKNILGIS